MIQSGAKSLKNSGAKTLKSSGRMMRQKVHKIAGGVGGGGSGQAPPMMIEEVMIQSGPKNIKKAAGGSSVPLRQGLMVQVRIQTRAK